MLNKFRESNQIVQWINKTNYSISQHKNADVNIFKGYISTKFQGSKMCFYEICYYYITVLFNGKG